MSVRFNVGHESFYCVSTQIGNTSASVIKFNVIENFLSESFFWNELQQE